MAAELCLIPEKCGRCGEIFDLSHDLENLGDENVAEAMSKIAKKLHSSEGLLCWVCRALVK